MTSAERLLVRRYARALFACAAARHEEAAVVGELGAGAAALSAALPLLRDPRVEAGQKKRLIRDSLRNASPLSVAFLELLIDKKRFHLLASVAVDLDKLLLQARRLVRARARTARPLSEADRRRLQKTLESFAGVGVELDVETAPELLGGVSVRLGDWLLDGSLRGQLQHLKEAIGGD